MPTSVRGAGPWLAILVVLTLLGVSGCSVGRFATAYFNTYYNAQHLFGEAEEEVWNQPETRQAGRSYLVHFNTPPQTRTKLTSVIEKCSKLLQYHGESSLVDDALLMIGKSYFYQEDLPKAERKFRELLADYPQSGLVRESRVLLAYTLYKEENRDGASSLAKDLLAEALKEGDDDAAARSALLLAQIERENKNLPQAREYYQQAARYAGTGEQRSTALMNVAEMFLQEKDFAKAQDAYREAGAVSGSYLGEYRGSLGVARMLSLQGKHEDALTLLGHLRENTNNRDFFGEIDLETANALLAEGDLQAAISEYRYVDSAYARTEYSAKGYYQLGQVYENRLGLYDSARVAYNKGKNEYAASALTPLLSARADLLNRYQQYVAAIVNYDTLRQQLLARRSSPVADSTARDSVRSQAQPSALPLDSLQARLALNKTELAGLFYTGLGRPDSALIWFSRVVIQYPASPFVPRALFTMAQIYALDSLASRGKADSLHRIVVARYPESEFAVESRRILGLPPLPARVDEAEHLYGRAEALIDSARGKEAIHTLREIVTRFPSSATGPRAEYAIGWVYEHLEKMPDSAVAAYRRVARTYPGSPYAAKVQPMITAVEAEHAAQTHPAADTSAHLQQTPSPAPAVPALQPPPGVPQQSGRGTRRADPRAPGEGEPVDSSRVKGVR